MTSADKAKGLAIYQAVQELTGKKLCWCGRARDHVGWIGCAQKRVKEIADDQR